MSMVLAIYTASVLAGLALITNGFRSNFKYSWLLGGLGGFLLVFGVGMLLAIFSES